MDGGRAMDCLRVLEVMGCERGAWLKERDLSSTPKLLARNAARANDELRTSRFCPALEKAVNDLTPRKSRMWSFPIVGEDKFRVTLTKLQLLDFRVIGTCVDLLFVQ